MSSALNGRKFDVMKFDSRKTVDISTWEEPIKLNRKELRREESDLSSQVPARPMLGPDGKPDVGTDGKIGMVDVDGGFKTSHFLLMWISSSFKINMTRSPSVNTYFRLIRKMLNKN
jgi:hypothetical protein